MCHEYSLQGFYLIGIKDFIRRSGPAEEIFHDISYSHTYDIKQPPKLWMPGHSQPRRLLNVGPMALYRSVLQAADNDG